jgi:hypothetical protein
LIKQRYLLDEARTQADGLSPLGGVTLYRRLSGEMRFTAAQVT